MPETASLPPGVRVVLDERTRIVGDGSVVLGGSPWGVVRLGPAASGLVRRLKDCGADGVVPGSSPERAAADRLIERGIVHPVAECAGVRSSTVLPIRVQVVVPAYGRPGLLQQCLHSLAGLDVVVVDDASPTGDVTAVAAAAGARVVRHPVNRGPAAARNTGLAVTDAPLIAFVDADCCASPGWLDVLLPLFEDPRVGAAAPRVVPRSAGSSGNRRRGDGLLARHERARSALDMGARRELVRHGGALGFLPSATLLVRRAALAGTGRATGRAFDEQMRVGEDVDLIWRLVDSGWLVRYEPGAQVTHEMRLAPCAWMKRRFEYGTSAAALDRRHPGRLAPVRPSAWNLAAYAAALSGHPAGAGAVAAGAAGALALRLRSAGVPVSLAPRVVGMGLLADAAAIGHALRREWWPAGWLALATSPRSRLGRAGAAAMLAPIALEWWRGRRDVDPLRYLALRLAEDAAYGSGVLVSAVAGGRPGALAPVVRLPRLRGATAS